MKIDKQMDYHQKKKKKKLLPDFRLNQDWSSAKHFNTCKCVKDEAVEFLAFPSLLLLH